MPIEIPGGGVYAEPVTYKLAKHQNEREFLATPLHTPPKK